MQEQNEIALLIDQLDDTDEKIRFAAAVRLGESRDERAAKPLILHLLHDKNAKVRSAIPFALHRIQADEAISAFMQVIRQDEDPIVRRRSVEELGWFGCIRDAGRCVYSEIVNLIIETLGNDPDKRVRESAIRILGVMYAKGPQKSELIIDELIKVFSKEEDASVKRTAIVSLGWTQADQAIVHLLRLQNDPNIYISRSATRILSLMKDPDWPPINLTRAIR